MAIQAIRGEQTLNPLTTQFRVQRVQIALEGGGDHRLKVNLDWLEKKRAAAAPSLAPVTNWRYWRTRSSKIRPAIVIRT